MIKHNVSINASYNEEGNHSYTLVVDNQFVDIKDLPVSRKFDVLDCVKQTHSEIANSIKESTTPEEIIDYIRLDRRFEIDPSSTGKGVRSDNNLYIFTNYRTGGYSGGQVTVIAHNQIEAHGAMCTEIPDYNQVHYEFDNWVKHPYVVIAEEACFISESGYTE